MRKLLLLSFLLTGSALSQQTLTFDEPIDALSITLPTDNTRVSVLLDDGWHRFAIEKEFDPTLQESDLVMFGTPTTSVTLRGQLHDIQPHPIRVSAEPAKYSLAATTYYRSPRILRRSNWGADDSLLYAGPDNQRSDEPSNSSSSNTSASYTSSNRVEDCNTARVNYPQDFKTSKTVTHDANGQRLRWARRYSPDVKLMVVHHTAQKISGDDRSAVERVRALYEYHANSRGWGDIGYHYLVDEQGGIYEGRSGGENVVGGHVYCGNVGTLGIALLGNFDVEQPTQKQVQSLQWLLDHLADTYDIDLNRSVSFKGKAVDPIQRHKDLISTDCPGYYMSSVIAQVRSNVKSGNLLAGVTFPRIAGANKVESRTQQRLSTRLAEAGQRLSRSYYRAKRLVRTASRLTSDSRMQAIEQQRQSGTSNIQRLRAARQARLQARRVPTTRTVQTIRATGNAPTSTVQTPNGNIRIRLSYTGNNAQITSDTVADVNGSSAKAIRLGKDGNSCVAVAGNDTLGEGVVRIDPSNGILTVQSWNTTSNRFRGVIECRIINNELVLINELPLEQYMAGLAEEPDTEPLEKQRAFAVAARSYAAHYMQPQYTKFPGMPYHGDDSPARFQKYGGVVFEEANPKWVQSVQDTANAVLMKDGDIVKAAYYSSNDGRTRSPSENGWRNFPHAEVFASKPDPWCEGMTLRGHGVGMSGCGAEGQALQGKRYNEILEYYYPGTTISPVSLALLQ